MNKKAFVDDGLLFLILFLVVAFVFLITGFINDGINTELISVLNNSAVLNNTVADITEVTDGTDTFFNADYLILLFFVGLCIFLIVSFYYIPSNPIFFIIGLVVLVILIIFSLFFKDFWVALTELDNDFSDSLSDHALIDNIFIWLPVSLLVLVCIILVVLYAKNQQGSFGG